MSGNGDGREGLLSERRYPSTDTGPRGGPRCKERSMMTCESRMRLIDERIGDVRRGVWLKVISPATPNASGRAAIFLTSR